MAELAHSQTVTFTVKAMPRTEGQRKTLARLMRLQPGVQKALFKLARNRRRDTPWTQRGGRLFARRKPATKVAIPLVGSSFSLRLTPQLLPDVKSISRYLDAKPSRA